MKFNSPEKNTILLIVFLILSADTFAQITANFIVNDSSGCAPLTANFTSTSTGSVLVWAWDFGDGGTSSSVNPTHIYNIPGVYTVSLEVSSFTGHDIMIKTNYIKVFSPPIANYSVAGQNVCSGDSVLFTDSSQVGDGALANYNWTFNDGTPPQTGINTYHAFVNTTTSIGIYTPTYTVTDINACVSTFTGTIIYVSPVPSASIGIGSMSPGGLPVIVNFTNNSIGFPFYEWNFGDPSSGSANISSLQTPTHVYNSLGTYWVTFIVGIAGCEAQDSLYIDLQLVGIKENSAEKNILIYPDPVDDLLMINFNKPITENSIINIYNSSGEKVLSNKIIIGMDRIFIDASELIKGVYFVDCSNGLGKGKFFKNK